MQKLLVIFVLLFCLYLFPYLKANSQAYSFDEMLAKIITQLDKLEQQQAMLSAKLASLDIAEKIDEIISKQNLILEELKKIKVRL